LIADRASKTGRGRLRAPVVLAYATFVLVGLTAAVGGVLLPAQIRDYGVDKATIGLTFFTFSAGFLLAGSTAGPLLHRLGTRLTLVAGGAAFVVAWLFVATRPAFAAFVIAQALAGYGTGLLESVLNAYLTDLPSAATLLNRLHAFFGVGALLGPLLAAWMIGFTSWTTVWLVLALAGVPFVAAYYLAFPAHEPPATESGAAGGRGLLGSALRQPAVLLATAFLAVYVGLEIGVGNWAFSLLVEEHGQRALFAGWTVSGYWLGLTLGRFLISPAAERLGLSAIRTSYLCLGGVAVSAAAGSLAPTAAVASVALLLLGFFLGPLFPTAMAVVPNLTSPRLVPTAIGVMNGGSVVGGALFPWLAGAVAQGVGVWTLLPFALTLALAQLAIWHQVATAPRPR
jgi:fucose permease